MRFYTKILPYENKRRLKLLIDFRKELITYFNNTEFKFFDQYLSENDEARKVRIKINLSLDEIYEIILNAGISPYITYTPPPAIGGFIKNIDLIHNIFHIQMYKMSPAELFDVIERAIGRYERNKRRVIFRLLNPFFYIGIALDFIAELPFILIGRIGFDRKKAESSFIGRIVKGFLQLVSFLAASFAVLNYLGYMDAVREFIRRSLTKN